MQTKSENVNRIDEGVLGWVACHFLKIDINAYQVSKIWQLKTTWLFNKKSLAEGTWSQRPWIMSLWNQKPLRWLETSFWSTLHPPALAKQMLKKSLWHNRFHKQTHKELLHTQMRLHTEPFTQKLFHTEAFAHKKLWHTKAFYTQKLLYTKAFTHRHFLHTEARVEQRFYVQR